MTHLSSHVLCPAGEPPGVHVHVSGSDRLLQTAGFRPSESPLRSHNPVWFCHGGTCTHKHTPGPTWALQQSYSERSHDPQVNGTEADFAKKALFSRHPEMIDWPVDHNWFFAKFNITQVPVSPVLVLNHCSQQQLKSPWRPFYSSMFQVWVLDYFGGVKTVTSEEYFEAPPHKKHWRWDLLVLVALNVLFVVLSVGSCVKPWPRSHLKRLEHVFRITNLKKRRPKMSCHLGNVLIS